jgi:hypothetical protein
MSGEVAVKEGQRGIEPQHPGLAKALKRKRIKNRRGDRLGKLQLPRLGLEMILVELGDVFQ